MTNEFSTKARTIVTESLVLEPERRASFVASACGEDLQLRREVESLLDAITISIAAGLPPMARLSPGEVLARRFRIVRFLASGGMGEVYEAEDIELSERVALKTIRIGSNDSDAALERFRREVQLSRKVTHPSVCRVFDLAHDDTPGRRVTFLTMQFLHGETLATRLRRVGRMSTDEALPLALELADALNAAHRAGIVHRDFKPGNVILVPSETGDHAVVTDFGLAILSAAQDSTTRTSLTVAGAVVGTLAYMAPEQLRGAEVTPAADIYALGVVLYEMVTGSRPFASEHPMLEANRRLTENPPSPRRVNPGLPPAWERVILRCLERDPQHRFRSAADVASSLQGKRVRLRTRSRRLAAAIIAAACLLIAAAAMLPRFVITPVKQRRSVAVLRFKNITNRSDTEWVSTELSEGLRTQLASAGQVRTISGEETTALERDFSLAGFDSLGKTTLAKLHRVGADIVILGSYADAGKAAQSGIHLNLQIQDTASGDTIGSLTADGTEGEISRLVSETGRRLRMKLGLADVDAGKERELAAAQPSAEAAPAYAAGLEKLRAFDAVSARPLLADAVAADLDFAFAHSALAEAWSALGYDGNARQESRKAYELSAKLGLEDRLVIEGRYHEMEADWAACIQSYSELYKYFPDNLEYALKLAHAQMLSGRAHDALATLKRMAPAFPSDPRIDLERAETLAALGDYRTAQDAAAAAVSKARASGTRLAEARSLIWSCSAFLNLGQAEAAKAACLEARAIDSGLGDRLGLARAATGLGNILLGQGDMAGARAMYEEALARAKEVGSRRDMSGALNNLGMVLAAAGDNDLAEARYKEALALQREIGFVNDMPATLANIADLLRQAGKLAESEQMLEEAITKARETGSNKYLSLALTNSAGVLFERGLLPAAESRYNEAMALQKQIGAKDYLGFTLAGLGDLLLAKGEFDAAEKQHRDAVAVDQELGDKLAAANARLGLANVSLERGVPEKAEAEAREALKEILAEKDPSSEIAARTVLGRALMAGNRIQEAQVEVAALQNLDRNNHDAAAKLAVAVLTARVHFAADRNASSEAKKELSAAASEADRLDMPGQRLEAELALAEIENATGKAPAARTRLEDVQKRAAALGFGAVVKRADQRLHAAA